MSRKKSFGVYGLKHDFFGGAFWGMVFGMFPVSAINYVSNMFIRFWQKATHTGAPGTQ